MPQKLTPNSAHDKFKTVSKFACLGETLWQVIKKILNVQAKMVVVVYIFGIGKHILWIRLKKYGHRLA